MRLKHYYYGVECNLFADDEGYYRFLGGNRCYAGNQLFTIYKTRDALKNEVFPNILEKGVDEFTKEPFIKATMFGGNEYGFAFGRISIRIEYTNNKHRLNVDFDTQSLKISPKHTLHFLLADGRVLTFSNFTKAVYYSENLDRSYLNRTSYVTMTEQDIQLLASQKVVKWNIINEEGVTLVEQTYPPLIDMSDDLREIHREVFQKFIIQYLSLYNEIKGETKEEKSTQQIDNEVKPQLSDTCYVYLMIDTTNNYHKIGISNNPRYREHTLQSDKPTIELLCSKEYPSRAIAEAIESALHKVYANKRIRGEWFNLNPSDIEEIKQTLK